MKMSIARKILATAMGLVALMALASSLSFYMANEVGSRIDRLTSDYIPAYSNLARANVRSLEQALALRRLLIAAGVSPMDEQTVATDRTMFDKKGMEFAEELQAARTVINAEIASGNAFADPVALARMDTRILALLEDEQRHYMDEAARLLRALATGNAMERADEMRRIETMRDEINLRVENIRHDMQGLLREATAATRKDQSRVVVIGAVLTGLAALLGLGSATLIGGGVARPMRRLLEGTKAIEDGHLDIVVPVHSHDEVGRLTESFNRMTEQLRIKERIRETFGRYIDPRVVEGIIDHPAIAQGEGQRRVMTILFCDMKGFTAFSEGMTPQGLVKVMNRYLTTMSEPIRNQRGVIDKYIGDAIMAYWGPPFVSEGEQAGLACLAALEMLERLEPLHAEVMDLLGMRTGIPKIDMRVGIATGDALVGNIGSDFMMSYTVMGDTVNFASRLESANKAYQNRVLISGATAALASSYIETREIDRLVVVGKTEPQEVFEVMARKGALTPAQEKLKEHFAEGLAAYRAQEWDKAKDAFDACLEIKPGDGPSVTFLHRIEVLSTQPPRPNWDGVWIMDHK